LIQSLQDKPALSYLEVFNVAYGIISFWIYEKKEDKYNWNR
jgi:hypothetical protein